MLKDIKKNNKRIESLLDDADYLVIGTDKGMAFIGMDGEIEAAICKMVHKLMENLTESQQKSFKEGLELATITDHEEFVKASKAKLEGLLDRLKERLGDKNE